MFQTDDVTEVRTNAIAGRYTIRDALDALLDGTSLNGGLTDGGVITISLKRTEGSMEENVSNWRRNSLLAGVTALFASTIQPVGAQEPSGGLDEILVVAQKRQERLQDVPASITALSGEDLINRGFTSTMQLAQSTPGLTFGSTGPWTNFYMRGIGNAFAIPSAQAPVAIYVDGVYEADTAAMAFGLDDVDHVEILKGPQGTLYGRNAVGGAINVITKTPSKDPEIKLRATAGNLGKQELAGYLTGGTDRVQANLAFDRHLRDGYYENIIPGADDLNNIDDFSVRSKLRLSASDRLEFTLAVDYSTQRGRGPGTTNLPYPPGSGVVPTAVIFGGIVPTDPWKTSNTSDLSSEAQNSGVALTGRYSLDSLDIVSITAARNFTNTHGVDFDASNATATDWRAHDYHRQISQEFQFISNGDGRFSWIAGLYYLHDDAGFDPFNLDAFASVGGAYVQLNTKVRSDSYAIFAEGTYDLTDQLSLILGGRYSVDEAKHYAALQTVTSAVPPFPVIAQIDSAGANDAWYAFTPRVSLTYQRPEGLYYITASQGYASGLYNITNIAPTAALDTPVEPQTVDAIEIGAKWQFGNTLQLNVAGFYYDLEDMQTFSIAGSALTSAQNANGRIQGVDVDAIWAVTPSLRLNAAFEILDTEYTRYPAASVWALNPDQGNLLVPPCGGQPGATPADSACMASLDLKGSKFIRSPNFTSTVGFEWDVPFIPDGSGFGVLTGTWYHSNSYWTTVNGSIVSPSYDSFGANFTYTLPNDRWSLSVWGNNLSDAEYYLTGADANYGAVIQLAEPRTYGASLVYHFGG